ncbi:MAG: F0F1 ATP synthase subunit B [Bacteroidales bacterium]|mgnify:FL=1|jgi:F-type H+-transporting ATPase subunit b
MSLLLPDSGLVFWMLISFGIVFAILAKYGFPVIMRKVEDREVKINDFLQKVNNAETILAELKTEGDNLISKAKEEQGRILKEAMQRYEKIIKEAQEETENILQKKLMEANELIRIEKENAVRDIHKQVTELSLNIAEKVLLKKLEDENEQIELINRILEEYSPN